jgi:D-alanyl-lipoteichoic acid acyltransferase DltB (MBOAT superfamily)
MTTFAVAVLALDSVLLTLAGIWLGRAWLFVLAGLCAGGVLATIALWRRYVRHVVELEAMIEARKAEAQREVESIRELLQSHSLNN